MPIAKDIQRVEWGVEGALKRYGGPPRTLSLNGLTTEQRSLVLSRVRALRNANARGEVSTPDPDKSPA